MSEHREQCKRQHRLFGQFLAIQAWRSGLDCIVVDREFLKMFFYLSRFKGVRIKWLLEDIKPWFGFSQRYYFEGRTIGSLFLSRVPISEYLPGGTMGDKERVKRMPPSSPKTGLLKEILAKQGLGYKAPKVGCDYKSPKGHTLRYPGEKWVTEYLLQLAAGLREP